MPWSNQVVGGEINLHPGKVYGIDINNIVQGVVLHTLDLAFLKLLRYFHLGEVRQCVRTVECLLLRPH